MEKEKLVEISRQIRVNKVEVMRPEENCELEHNVYLITAEYKEVEYQLEYALVSPKIVDLQHSVSDAGSLMVALESDHKLYDFDSWDIINDAVGRAWKFEEEDDLVLEEDESPSPGA